MSIIVFAGPSACGMKGAAFAGMRRFGPASRGDIIAAVRDGAAAIGLIDGLFGDRASVWHKEILIALDHGVAVFGAASMGALRAAECDVFGMIGVGRIYEEYRTGARRADADVAVLHAPAEIDHAPLTVALVDAEATVELVQLLGAVDRFEAEALREAACSLHFRERTWARIAAEAIPDRTRASQVETLCRRQGFSRKREDAAELLAALQAGTPPAGLHAAATGAVRTLFLSSLRSRSTTEGP